MTESLQALLSGVIDYAGLFPPAKLPLAESLENYVRYRQSGRNWMLGGFVVPAAQLPALAKLPVLSRLSELPLALVASPTESLATAADSLRGDFQAVAEFIESVAATCGVQVRVALEWRLPADAVAQDDGLPKAFDCLPAGIPLPLQAVWCEVPLPRARPHAHSVASFAWRTNVQLGLKFRTGGLEAAAFPSSELLAAALAACLELGTPWKCTAGLHHPLPRQDAGVNARMHGFINVLLAAALGKAHQLDVAALTQILETDAPEAFQFKDAACSWTNGTETYAATVEQIQESREFAMNSFGSCSCEEPWDDLKALGWMA